MELELIRTYYPDGTTGNIFYEGSLITYCIELPWKNNHTRVSCIPEGKYPMMIRYNAHFNQHFELMDVPGRKDILIHPANDAIHELKGCIAPVSILIGENRGWRSREALAKILTCTLHAFQSGDSFFLIIKSML
jgi:Family of unknown function (DUF5675)